MNDILY